MVVMDKPLHATVDPFQIVVGRPRVVRRVWHMCPVPMVPIVASA